MKLLITGAWKCSENATNLLEKAGFETAFMPDERAGLPVAPETVDAAVCNGLFLYHNIGLFSRLKAIQLTSAGFDRVPVDVIKRRNILLFGAGDAYSQPIAESIINGVLQLYRESEFFSENRKRHVWEKKRTLKQLGGKNVCIIGCGCVGSRTAQLFSAFGCKVYGVDNTPRDTSAFLHVFKADEIRSALSTSDVTVITVPLCPENYHLINDDVFGVMKPRSVFVNVSRGAVVDEIALARALETHLFGAVLDVFENEPLNSESKLWDLPNVILTPHCAFISDENQAALEKVIMKNLFSLIQNNSLR